MTPHRSAPRRPHTQRKPSRVSSSTPRESTSLASYLPHLLRGIGLGLASVTVIASLLCAVAAAVLHGMDDPDAPMVGVCLTLLMLCATVYGGVIGRVTRERILLGGLIGGVVLLGAMFILSYIPTDVAGLYPNTLALPLRVAAVLFTTLGTYLGALLPSPRRKRAAHR